MLAAGAAGYVLGARAGRERYDRIASLAGRVWRDPRVQQRKDQATAAATAAARDAAATATHRASDAAQQAVGAVRDTVQGSGDDPLTRPTDPVPDPGASNAPERTDTFPGDPGQPAPGEPGQSGAAR